MPAVRVGIVVDTAQVEVGSTGPFDLVAAGNAGVVTSAADESWAVSVGTDGGLEAGNGARSVSSRGPILIRPRAGGLVSINGRTFRGDALVRAASNGVTAVNLVDIEDYLLGVVPQEIGRRPAGELEAVKAQAVAARTYAIGNLGGRESLGFDYFASVQDQVYGGVSDEDPVATRAVRETRGQIVTYDGVPILAYYSSTCGGRTAAIEESWPWRGSIPYLRSVSDRVPGTDRYYCDASNRFRWSATWTRTQLLETLGATLREYTGAPIDPIARIGSFTLTRNRSERATIAFDANGERYVIRSDSIRWVLRLPGGVGMNSSLIERIESEPDTGDDVSTLTVLGRGWGHGIGMCQVGALGRARSGQRYTEILRAYYTGTEIRRLY